MYSYKEKQTDVLICGPQRWNLSPSELHSCSYIQQKCTCQELYSSFHLDKRIKTSAAQVQQARSICTAQYSACPRWDERWERFTARVHLYSVAVVSSLCQSEALRPTGALWSSRGCCFTFFMLESGWTGGDGNRVLRFFTLPSPEGPGAAPSAVTSSTVNQSHRPKRKILLFLYNYTLLWLPLPHFITILTCGKARKRYMSVV